VKFSPETVSMNNLRKCSEKITSNVMYKHTCTQLQIKNTCLYLSHSHAYTNNKVNDKYTNVSVNSSHADTLYIHVGSHKCTQEEIKCTQLHSESD